MASRTVKDKASASSFEIDADDLHLRSKVKAIRSIDGIRIGLTVLALLMGISVLGVSADTLNVYNTTRIPANFHLSLWPKQFDLRPTTGLVAGAALVVVVNATSLLFSKVSSLRNQVPVHTSITFAAPLVGLIAAVVAMALFYSINASESVDTMLSWTCRWEDVKMLQRPEFGTLCKESRAGVYMSILLIPVEAAVLAVAGWQMKVEKHASAYADARRTPSPAMA